MDKTQTKSGWEIKVVSRSQLNGRFYIEGLNHESTDPLFAKFSWHVRTLFDDSRYFFAYNVVITGEMQRELLSPIAGMESE
jgi:hypothetical protein